MSTTTLPPAEKTQPVSAPDAKTSDRAKSERKLGWLLAGPALVVMLMVTAYPIAQAIYDSLFDFRLTDPDNRSFTGLSNYAVILTDWLWWRSLLVTGFITLVTVAVELVLGFALAMVMAKALSTIGRCCGQRSSSRTRSSPWCRPSPGSSPSTSTPGS